MSGAIIWRRAGIVLLVWLLISVLGIVLFLMSSQFRNAGYEKIRDGNVTNYQVDPVSCSSGSSTVCYNGYAVVSFDYTSPGVASGACLLFSTHDGNSTVARAAAQSEFPMSTEFSEIFREIGTQMCYTEAIGTRMAIAGVVMLSIGGIILLLLPLYYPHLLASVTTGGDSMLPGKVQVSELVAPTTTRTKKEMIELKQAEVLAKARKKSISISKEQQAALSAKRMREAAEDAGAGRFSVAKMFSVGL